MKTKRTMAMALLAGLLLSAPAHAGFYYGDETKGATLTTNEADINMRIRLQPRLDYGDIVKSKDGTAYEKDADMYLRRLRLELGGSLIAKTLKYSLTITGDKWDQAGHTGALGIQYANVEWEADDALSIVFGKEKLPYSRVSLTSSSKRLFIENPVSTEAAKKLFGKTDPYYQPKLAARGRLLDGVISYEAALADGWQNGETIQTGRTVFRGKPLYVARVELSPPGWVEKKKSDAHLGKDQHLALGLNYAGQKGIEYNIAASDYEENRTLAGFDISGHYKGLGFQYENNRWAVSSDDPAVADVKPKGWYAQAGYFIDGLNIEPAARYEVYDQDSGSTDMKKEKTSTYGVNWYLKGHSLKAGLNRVTTKYEDKASGRLLNDDTKTIYQIQVQMYY
ncbi:MAG: OprO/OprP family phosphate-selective porin [Deltaproteobacteria bacterium]|nr:OprO/OprP family phosphate-selective porin [Deltaproteobacteria bacterium]